MSPEKFAEAVEALVHATTAVAQCGMLHCPRCLPKYDAARQRVLDAHAEVVKSLEYCAMRASEVELERDKALTALRQLQSELASALAERDFWKLQRTPLTEAELERGYAIAKKHGVDVERIRELEEQFAAVVWRDDEAGVWVVRMGNVLSQGTTPEEALAAGHSAVDLTIDSMAQRMKEAFNELAAAKGEVARLKAAIGGLSRFTIAMDSYEPNGYKCIFCDGFNEDEMILNGNPGTHKPDCIWLQVNAPTP